METKLWTWGQRRCRHEAKEAVDFSVVGDWCRRGAARARRNKVCESRKLRNDFAGPEQLWRGGRAAAGFLSLSALGELRERARIQTRDRSRGQGGLLSANTMGRGPVAVE